MAEMPMDRFDRQVRIPGWRQEAFVDATVAVHGRSWLGCGSVWALANLGVGHIPWIGTPESSSNTFAHWLLADPCPIPGCHIVDYPCAVEYGGELNWALDQRPLHMLVDCGEDARSRALCRHYASRRGVGYCCGATADGGWIGSDPPASSSPSHTHPVTSMIVASLLVESVREAICPLFPSRAPRAGPLALVTPELRRRANVVLVGVGGIGVYVAALSAIAGHRLCLVDVDRVEQSNLNRQGLFSAEDAARQAPKAEAAARALQRIFPAAPIFSIVTRVDRRFKKRLASLQPAIILSAVDNAATRLAIQNLGRDLGVPVIQGGTDVFAADCFCQEVNGPELDTQMHGALSEASAREKKERPRRHGRCAVDPSYVIPGMLCGALMAHRMTQVLELYHGMGPIRWRAGEWPKEDNHPHRHHDFDFNQCHLH